MSDPALPLPEDPEAGESLSWVAHLAVGAALLTCIAGWVLLMFKAMDYFAPYNDLGLSLPPLALLVMQVALFARGVIGMACFAGLLVLIVLAWRKALKGGFLATLLLFAITLGAGAADALFLVAFAQAQRHLEDIQMGQAKP